MKNYIRVLLLLTPIIIVGLAIYEQTVWHPPINPDMTQQVRIGTLLDLNETYKAPMKLIINGDVYNKSVAEDLLFLDGGYFKVNCTNVNISDVKPGMRVYIMGYSYYHDPSKEYFLAEKIHIFVSYSVYLSIPGAFLILIILFVGFKFELKDFSFSRKPAEESKDA